MEGFEIKAKNIKQRFICTSKDKIMYNGRCYQLVTQSVNKNFFKLTPVISKTEFNRLLKCRILSEPYLYKTSSGVIVTMYDFIFDESNERKSNE